jgi:hypothetical protein
VRAENVRPALVAVLVVAAAQVAAVEPPALEVRAPETAVSVGDRVPVQVSARGGGDLMWGELSVEAESGGSWEVVSGPREVEGSRPPVWQLVVAPMKVGDLELPPMRAVVRLPGGEAQTVVASDLPKVSVASVLPPDDNVEPEPLRAPLGVHGFPWEWVLPIGFPLLLIGAALAAWMMRRRAGVGGGPTVELAPFEELDQLLRQLEERVGHEPAEGVCDRLAGGLRRFLERRSNEPAEEMTSFELRLLARRLGWPEAVQRGVQDVMRVADGTRFGRLPASDGELLRAVEEARSAARGLEEHLTAAEESGAEEVVQ